jgi:hypothetical protein
VSLTARAEVLADLSEPAAGCASCFCRARCAGLDIKAIAAVARAAMRLGAEQAWLYRDEPPCPDDAAYLDELHALRIRLRQVASVSARLYEEAHRQAVMARRALRAARDETARALALQMLNDANTAMDITHETAVACSEAGRLLLVAEADFRWVYEDPEALVASGNVLPYDGRWITGQATSASGQQ